VSDVEAPKIGDTRPAPELGDPLDDLEPDPRDLRIAELEDELARATPPPQLREFAERMQARNATLEPLAEEVAALKRTLGLVTAGVDPTSMLGQTVSTAAAADGVSDPEQVAALARTLRAEMNGGAGRQEVR
jgi:hypothetical protein